MKKWSLEEIKSILAQTQNERFEFTDSDRERALTNPYLEETRKQLIAEGERLRGTPILEAPFSAFKRFEIEGNRRDFEVYYFAKRCRLTTFALLAWLYGREEDIKELENIIWAILNEYTWSLPAHLTRPGFANEKSAKNRVGLSELQEDGHIIDLFAAETGAALSEMLSLVGDKLTPILVKRTERYIKTRILDMLHEDYTWKHTYNNWKAVCGGCCGIAAFHQEHDIDKLASAIYMILPHLQDFCDSYTSDGACVEGMAYWIYGFGFFVYFADMLKKRTAGKIDLFTDEKVEKMALFFQKCFMPMGKSVVFSDATTSCSFFADLTSYLHNTYNDAVIPPIDFIKRNYDTSCSRFAYGLRLFTWTDERLGEKATEICGINILEDAQWYVGSSKNGIGLAAKAGNNGEPHNHNDVGSFHIYKNGNMTLADIGSGEYTKDYFGPLRYTYFVNTSASHNLPIVNGILQSPGKERAATNVSICKSGIKCDIAGIYDDPTLSSLVRDIRFNEENGAIDITDTYEFTETPSAVVERFVSFDKPVPEVGRILIGNADASVLTYDAELFDVSLKTETYSNHSATKITVYLIDLTVKNPTKSFEAKFNIS